MMSKKKELRSEQMDTVKKSRTPFVVLIANGEVHTHELFVHGLNLFVTVQFLEETPAVLSLRRLCEDHGYSCEWVSGPKPRLTKDGKSIICKTYNFVPLVVRLDKKRDGKSNQATGDLLQVHLQVQSVSEQSGGQETGAILRKTKPKLKEG